MNSKSINSRREEISENLPARVSELAIVRALEQESLADYFKRRRRLLRLQAQEILKRRTRNP